MFALGEAEEDLLECGGGEPGVVDLDTIGDEDADQDGHHRLFLRVHHDRLSLQVSLPDISKHAGQLQHPLRFGYFQPQPSALSESGCEIPSIRARSAPFSW
jgi:hypothetical protein